MIFLAFDHGGRELGKNLLSFLQERGHAVFCDPFCLTETPLDYPDVVPAVVRGVLDQNGRGILLCRTGIGMSIAANRYKGIRAALCHTPEEARLSREHNDANILVMGSLPTEIAHACCEKFLKTAFLGERHARRLLKIENLS